MVEYIASYNPMLEALLPNDWTNFQKIMKCLGCAVNWLECATFEEYPFEVRAAWQQRGREWLDLADKFTGPGLEFRTIDAECSFNEIGDRALLFWDRTVHLNTAISCLTEAF